MKKEKVLLEATLCYPVRDDKVLLSMKTKNIGEGCWNGYGGGTEEGETLKETAARELKEEVGLTVFPEDLKKTAVIDFHNQKSDGEIFICTVHIYLLFKWQGRPRACAEMIAPTWFSINNLPVDEMMLADKIWLPHVLRGEKIKAVVKYGPFQKTLLGEVKIEKVDSFD